MRTLSRLWRSLETLPGLAAIAAYWEEYCGPDVSLVRPHLRLTDKEGSHYPCPDPWIGVCPRRIVDYGNGEYAALCGDPYQRCERVPLTRKDVLVQELDLASFSRVLAEPLGVHWRTPAKRGDGIWAVGLSNRRDSKSQPVFLAVLPETRRFEAALHRLLLSVTGPFVLAAPTGDHLTVEARELLQHRGVGFLSLEEQLLLDDSNRLVAAATGATEDNLQATPMEDRRRVVAEFLTSNRCKVKDIQDAAEVHPADYYKWLDGTRPDHYSTCIAIERVLRQGLGSRQDRRRAATEEQKVDH